MSEVLFLHGSNDLYGASRVLLTDVEILAGLGARVRVVVPHEGPLTPALLTAGAEVLERPIRVLRRVRPISLVEWPWRLPVSTSSREVVVLWTLALAPYLPALVSARSRVVMSVHEILRGHGGSMLARLANRCAGTIMVNSKATASWMLANGGAESRIRMMYPVAGHFLPLRERDPGSVFKVLVAARISRWKGQLQAVDAVQRLRDEGLSAELTFAGAPFPGQEVHLERLLSRIAGLNWARYVGQVTDIKEILEQHDVLLVASTEPEPFGVVALEAWSSGRRVVAPDEGGAAEASRMADGIVYRPRDTESMANALRFVATHPAIRAAPSVDAPASHLCTVGRRKEVWIETLDRVSQ